MQLDIQSFHFGLSENPIALHRTQADMGKEIVGEKAHGSNNLNLTLDLRD